MPTTHAPDRLRSPAALLAALGLAQLLIGLDYNIVFVALPEIASLGFSPQTLQWVVSAYAIAFGGFLLLCGRLTDTLGRRRMFLAGLGLFMFGSLLGTFAVAEWMLILGRGFQGLGGAALAPATLALLSVGFPEGAERNRALGIWGAAGSAGMVLGSILGRVLTDAWGWRAVFAVNIPIVAAIAVLAVIAVPADRLRPSLRRLDVPGAALTTASAILIVMGLTFAAEKGWTAAPTLLSLGVGLLSALTLVIVERRTRHPLLDLAGFRSRHLATGVASTFLFMAGFGASAYFLTLYFQETRGLSPLATGLAFVIPCLGVLAGTMLGGRLATRTGLRTTMATGQVIGLLGVGAIAVVVGAHTVWIVVFALVLLFSLGQGIVFTTMFATATTGVDESAQGYVGGLATAGQQIGGAIGLAVLITLTTAMSGPSLSIGMTGIAAIIGLGLLVALFVPAKPPAGLSGGRHDRSPANS
ncbi:MFS transporter [Brevibacterium casei]|uniref:Transport protein n=1 Tax=Brevibacterium casei S18 TaxID=1229781 RepID=K9AVG6_9MICO|nr:MFS transporter [Brevibacterium casei]EKU45445.1 transport protein [Brevibacterium casei S18]QQT69198.1 MFS transporter [Brevibacterium casei]